MQAYEDDRGAAGDSLGESGVHPRAETFDEVFDALSADIWRALLRLGVRERDVDDALQETFLVVHRRLGDFEGRSSLRTFVYGIALRVASDYRRRAYHRRVQLPGELPDSAVAAEQDRWTARRDARAVLDALLAQLDEPKLQVFVLFSIEELPMAEVAEAVGCTVKAGYRRLDAARKQMKKTLETLELER